MELIVKSVTISLKLVEQVASSAHLGTSVTNQDKLILTSVKIQPILLIGVMVATIAHSNRKQKLLLQVQIPEVNAYPVNTVPKVQLSQSHVNPAMLAPIH